MPAPPKRGYTCGMSAKRSGTSRLLYALLLGLVATGAIVALHLSGQVERVELQTLDFRFRHWATAPENDQLVHIDIDDRSLEELGRWPWPRKQQAGVVDVLAEAGADNVALDIILPLPQQLRYVSEARDLLSADTSEMASDGPPRAIYDDKILAETLAKYGRAFLPMHIDPSPATLTPHEQSLMSILAEKPDATPQKVAELLALPRPPTAIAHARARKAALIARTESALRLDPTAALIAVVRQVIPGRAVEPRSKEFDIIHRAYLRLRGLASLKRFAIDPKTLNDHPVGRGSATPPLVTLADAAAGSGFVTVDPDEDGVVRRIPLLIRSEVGVFPQFALTLAAEQLAADHGGAYTILAGPNSVTIRCGDGFERIIPTDDRGQLLINWIRRSSADSRPLHISTLKPGGIWKLDASLARLRRLQMVLLVNLANMVEKKRTSQIADMYKQLGWLLADINELETLIPDIEFRRQRAMLFAPNDVALDEAASLRRAKRQKEDEFLELAAKLQAELQDANHLDFALARPAETAPVEDRDAYRLKKANATRLLTQLALIEQRQAEITADRAANLAELRELVAGKLAMIGSVATGAADFVPTPMHERMPGVEVHSNIFNTIVSGAFITRASRRDDVIAIVLAGLVICLLSTFCPVWAAGLGTLLLAAGYAAANSMFVFARLNIWLALWAPPAAMLLNFAVITAWRQLTEERAKRRIRGLFAHALSPALVDRLLEDPALLDPAKRELTFFFSDLQGFTTLAERLGEERTVRLLHGYFDRMTDVVQGRCGGYLNKFLGDGLFVFFGAPVLQEDHAARALRAAVQCQSEVAALNRELLAKYGVEGELVTRIGLTTGEVMVGDCGSSQRFDYTAIGDTVNLASRLESANKFFGTNILADGEAWRQGGDETILARPFGLVRVVGKIEAVEVWNLLGERDRAPANAIEACKLFAEAIEHLESRQFEQAAEGFDAVLDQLPGDRPAEIFAELARRYQAAPPASDWDTALELTQK